MSKHHDEALNRLSITLFKLARNDRPTIKELAKEFNVSVRTIQRDLNRLVYFPIEKDTLGQLKFIDGYSLSKTTFDDSELLVTYLALSQLKNINDKFDKNIERVFSKLLYPGYHSIFHVKPEAFEELDADSKKIEVLEKAIEEKRVCQIHINKKSFIVEAYKIICLDGIWYLLANNQGDLKVKSFLLSKIEQVKLSTAQFKASKPIDKILENVHSGFFEDGSSIEVVIRVFPQIAHYFKIKEFLPTQKILEEEKDNSLIISFEVTHYEDIDNIIKSWIPHIEVLEPKDYKDQLLEELEAYMLKLTSTSQKDVQNNLVMKI